MSEQPEPTPNDGPDLWLHVINDMESRRRCGIERYHTVLQPNNGRDCLLDAYEEALDMAVYLKQAIVERRQLRAKVEVLKLVFPESDYDERSYNAAIDAVLRLIGEAGR